MPDARRLIVNADDFGLSAGVNRGVLEAHETGVVSSVSVLVNAPGWTDAAQRLRDLSSPPFPALGDGLHPNLTTGRPAARFKCNPTPRAGKVGADRSRSRCAASAERGAVAATATEQRTPV